MGVQGVLISKKLWIIVKEKERSELLERLSFKVPFTVAAGPCRIIGIQPDKGLRQQQLLFYLTLKKNVCKGKKFSLE